MKTCKDCRHWVPVLNEEFAGHGERGECKHPTLWADECFRTQTLPRDGVMTCCSDYVFTGPDFGCIHWVAR